LITIFIAPLSPWSFQSIISPKKHPKNIEASQRMLRINSQEEELGRMSSPLKRGHLKLEIKTLSDAPRDADKLSTTSVLLSN
jgi:hypothetical protein